MRAVHELGLATEILRSCRAHLGDPPGRLTRVRLAVGELSAVEPELLRSAWHALIEGSAHAGAALEIEWRRARQVCGRCGEAPERSPGAWWPRCPRCGGSLAIEGGQELDLLELSYEPRAAREEVTP